MWLTLQLLFFSETFQEWPSLANPGQNVKKIEIEKALGVVLTNAYDWGDGRTLRRNKNENKMSEENIESQSKENGLL